METKFRDLIGMIINLTIGCIVFYTSLDYASGSEEKNAILINLGTFLTMNVCILIGMISMITCFIVRHKMHDIIQIFEEVDLILERLKVRINFEKYFIIFSLGYCGFGVLMTIILIAMFFITADFMLIFLNAYSSLNLSLGMSTLVALVFAIFIRLRSMNMFLKDEFLNEPEHNLNKYSRHVIVKTSSSHQITKLLLLMIIHEKVLDVVDMINRNLAFQTMFSVAWVFIYSLFTTFTFYKAFLLQQKEFFLIAISGLMWCFYLNMFIVFLICFCSLTTNEAQKTLVSLKRIINKTHNPAVLKVLKSFSFQVSQRMVLITCGLFDFNWNLVFMIISAFATYFIILMQFENGLTQQKAL
ncbi:unnamed protein product [Diamesa serratosioi]